jgi:hypothetical protein
MSYFACVPSIVDGKGVVTDVIRADQDFINAGYAGDPFQWVQTNYNTRGNVYYTPDSYPPEPDPDQSKALRANYAGLGFTYDSINDVFYAPDPGEGYVLDPQTWLWVPV